jgi:uncharacterized protein (DUF427 family)
MLIAESHRAVRVVETSHPPTYYLPPKDVRTDLLTPTRHITYCEFKGMAVYWTIRVGDRKATNAAWSYPDPASGYEDLRDHLAFYPSRVDACYVDDQQVTPQPGDFYGGWITSDIIGPFKGTPGSESW